MTYILLLEGGQKHEQQAALVLRYFHLSTLITSATLDISQTRFEQAKARDTSQTRQRHYENTPIQIYGKFHLQKTENFQIKNADIFHISSQNIDCGYSLEPPRRGGSNEYPQSMFYAVIRKKIMYIPVNPSFTI